MKARLAGAAVIAACALAALRQPAGAAALALDRWFAARVAAGSLPLAFGPETFSARGNATGAPGWLGALITGQLAALSPYAVPAMSALLCALALGALFAMCEPAGPAIALTAVSLAGVTFTGGFISGTLGYELIAALAFIGFLRRPESNWSLACIPIAIVWCNLAPSGLLAGPIALAATIGAAIDARGTSPALRRLVAIAFGSLGAALCTPGGARYASDAVTHLSFFDEDIETLTVWNPNSRPLALFGGFIPLLVLSAWIGWRRTGRSADLLAACVAVFAALANVAYLPIAGAIVAYTLALAARDLDWPAILAFPGARFVLPAAAPLLALAVALSVAIRPPLQEPYAQDDVAALEALHVHRLFCSIPAWCSLALASGPAVYMDGRVTAYPEKVRETAAAIAGAKKTWHASLDRLQIDAVMTGDNLPLSTLLSDDPAWRRLPSQGGIAVYVRNA
jgi:hypothetical protein